MRNNPHKHLRQNQMKDQYGDFNLRLIEDKIESE
jgi:hypothetical protein